MPLHLMLLPASVGLLVWLLLPTGSTHHHHEQRSIQATSGIARRLSRMAEPLPQVAPEQVPAPLALAAPTALGFITRRIRARISTGRP